MSSPPATLSRTARIVFAVSLAAFVATVAVLCASVLTATWSAQQLSVRARAVSTSATAAAPQWAATLPSAAGVRDAVRAAAARAAGTVVPSVLPASLPALLRAFFALDVAGTCTAALALEPLVIHAVRRAAADLQTAFGGNAQSAVGFLDDFASAWNGTRAVLERLVTLNKNPCVPEPDLGVLNVLYPSPFNFFVNNVVPADIRGLGANLAKLASDVNETVFVASASAGASVSNAVAVLNNVFATAQSLVFNPILPTTCSACPGTQVLCADGTCAAAAGACVVAAVPRLVSVSPAFGVLGGGNTVTLTFANLPTAPTVEKVIIGGVDAVIASTATATSVLVRPAAGLGPSKVSVQVQTAQYGPLVLPNSYTYFGVPSISGFTPNSGPRSGGIYITVHGQNLQQPLTAASLAGVSASIGTNANASVVLVLGSSVASPSGPAIINTTLYGGVQSTATFTYNADVTIASVTPTSILTGKEALLTITGTGFTTPIVVVFGVTIATVVSSTSTEIVAAFTPVLPGPFGLFVRTGLNGFLSLGNAVTASAVAPVLLSAQYTNTLNAIVMTFSQPLRFPGTSSCGALFVSGDSQFGASAQCVQSSAAQISVFGLSNSATIAIGTNVTVLAGGLQAANSPINVIGSVPLAGPTINTLFGFVVAPDRLPTCSRLILNAFVFSGTGGRQLTFAWSVSPANGDVTAELSAQPFQMLSMDASLLLPGVAYTFSVNVTNFIGQSTLLTTPPVMRSALAIPAVTIAGATTISTTANRYNQAFAMVNIPSCGTYTGITFNWAVTSGVLQSSLSATTAFLGLPAYIMSVTTNSPATFVFTVTAAAATNATLASTATVTFVVTPVEPIVVLSLPPTVFLSEGDAIPVDASRSINRNNNEALACAWTCSPVVGGVCPLAPFASASSCTTQWTGEASAGLYEVSVTVTDESTGQSAIKSSQLNVTSSGPIQCLITLPAYILPGQTAVLGSSAAADATFVWSGTDSIFTASALYSGTTGPYLVINGNSLEAGAQYTVNLACSAGVRTGSSTVTLSVVAPPSNGLCSCNQSTVEALVDSLYCSCSDFQSDNTPLTYQFLATSGSGYSIVLSDFSTSAVLQTTLGNPPSFAGNTLSLTARIRDSLGSQTTVSVGTVTVTQASNLNTAVTAGTNAIDSAVNTGNYAQATSALLATASVINRFGESIASAATVRNTLATTLATFSSSIQTQSFMTQISSSLSQVLGVTSLSASVITSGLSAIQNMLTALTGNTALQMDASTAGNIISSLANIMQASTSKRSGELLLGRTTAAAARSSLLATLTSQLGTMVCGQNAATTTATSVSTAIQQVVQTGYNSLGIASGSATVSFPATMGAALGISSSTCANVLVISYLNSPFSAPASGTLASHVVEVRIETTAGVLIDSGTLASNVAVFVPTSTAINTATSDVSCIRMDPATSIWSSNGCTVVATASTGVNCSCNAVGPVAATTTARTGTSGAAVATWIIAVAVCGGVLLIAAIVAIVCGCRHCRNKAARKNNPRTANVPMSDMHHELPQMTVQPASLAPQYDNA